MKEIKLDLRIAFSDDVKVEHLQEILKKITDAIVGEARNGMGIAPDGADYHTQSVEVSHINVNHPIKKKVY